MKTHHYKFEGDHLGRIGDPGWEDEVELTEYEGRPTSKSNQAWADLIQCMYAHIMVIKRRSLLTNTTQVGSTSITEEEKSRLPFDTAPNVLKGGEYVIGLQVFHQLHCLVHAIFPEHSCS